MRRISKILREEKSNEKTGSERVKRRRGISLSAGKENQNCMSMTKRSMGNQWTG